MLATAIGLTDQHLETELQAQHKEIRHLRERLQAETRSLGAAQAERDRIVDGIARGTVKESEMLRVKAEIESIQIRVEGLNKLVTPLESKIRELTEESDRRQ